jgi:protein-histidine N-methyltransferase
MITRYLIIYSDISAASASYRATLTPDNNPPERFNPSIPSEINITPELKSAFLSSLEERNLSLRFFAGSWDTFDFTNFPPQGYNIVLTSETIYRAESLPSLVTLLRSACLGITPNCQSDKGDDLTREPGLCLVAAKAVYFGVGGSVSNFIDAVEGNRGREKLGNVETVWETKTGVKRNILSVAWSK